MVDGVSNWNAQTKSHPTTKEHTINFKHILLEGIIWNDHVVNSIVLICPLAIFVQIIKGKTVQLRIGVFELGQYLQFRKFYLHFLAYASSFWQDSSFSIHIPGQQTCQTLFAIHHVISSRFDFMQNQWRHESVAQDGNDQSRCSFGVPKVGSLVVWKQVHAALFESGYKCMKVSHFTTNFSIQTLPFQ